MKRPAFFGIFSILFLIILALLFMSIYDKPKFLQNTTKVHREVTFPFTFDNKRILEPGSCTVVNIWIDSFSRLDVLKDHNIKYLFVDIGDTDKNGKIKTPENEITSFLSFISSYEKAKGYSFILLPYSEVNSAYYDIDSRVFQDNFIRSYAHLDSLGFDGLLIDIENINPGQRQSYISLLNSLRNNLPKNAIISVYAGALVDNISSDWEWDYSFYESVSSHVDLVSASSYDSNAKNADDYKEYVSDQVDRITSGNFSSYFFFAVPTHKDYPETIENSLLAYTESIKKHPKNNFLGLCVFAEWTADDKEWFVFEKYINN